MKIIFNDATELVVQSASIRADGSLLIKTISATEEELRSMFQDEFKTKKMTVTERESTLGEYENYTNMDAIVKYSGYFFCYFCGVQVVLKAKSAGRRNWKSKVRTMLADLWNSRLLERT